MRNASELPRVMLVTSRALMQPSLESALEAALRGGARLIQLREELPPAELRDLALRAAKLCRDFDARLIVNGNAEIARFVGNETGCVVGAHFKARDISKITRAEGLWRSVSIHSVEEAMRAENCGAEHLVFGSVFQTASHPGARASGLEMLRAVCAATMLPVFAIGGIDATNAHACLENGAHGVAVIRAVWQSDDVETATRALLRAARN